ncbi:MAG TPA: PilX N-terminal domain-containing pilus assembly protein [archaeon]|nr:PilX N-terminal domain-containing pilus assembly protein [archaeon]
MKTLKKIISSERGVALITMMLLLSALTLLAAGAMMVSSIDLKLATNYYQNSRAFYAAEAGVEKALSDIQTILDGQGTITDQDLNTVLPPELDNFTFEEFKLERSAAPFVITVNTGPYMGMVSLNQPINITSKVIGPGNSRYHIMVSVEGLQIPIFQFGVFYDDSLQIHNGASMDFIGRVHTNSSIFLGPGTTSSSVSSKFHRPITVAGDLYLKKIPSGDINDQVFIDDPSGNSINLGMNPGQSSATYPGGDESWVAYTDGLFQGRLRTRAHNITPLGMPIPKTIDPIEIIKRRNAGDEVALRLERLDWKADLRIYANAGLSSISIMDSTGNPKVLTNGNPSAVTSAIQPQYNAFYDDREKDSVDLLIVYVNRLTAADIGNGIVYISIVEESDRHKGIMLDSASTLPGPVSFVSDNAIYIRGNYNTGPPWRPSAVMADAVNLLSNAWKNAENPKNHSPSPRAASTTTYYVAILGGDTPNLPDYNGGLENFPRFLENWSGINCNIVGSFINLWLSENADGDWSYGGPIYTAPGRNWSFDVRFLDFNQLPPGTPSVGSVLRIAFRQEFYE